MLNVYAAQASESFKENQLLSTQLVLVLPACGRMTALYQALRVRIKGT